MSVLNASDTRRIKEQRRKAVQAWLDYRAACHAASPTRAGGQDPMRAMLSEWWSASKLPRLDACDSDQLASILTRIAQLEWEGRPFE